MTTLMTFSDSVLRALVPLAEEAPAAENVDTGWWYVVVFFGLVAATVLLWLSMRKQLKKIRFEEKPRDSADADRPDAGQ